MHCNIGNNDECPREDCQANDVLPQCQIVESKGTQDAGPGNLDVQSVPVVL